MKKLLYILRINIKHAIIFLLANAKILKGGIILMKIEHMEKGKAYIRIIPRSNPYNTNLDWSFTSDIMIFDGMSENGNPIMHYQSETTLTRSFGNKPRELNYTMGWMPANIIWNGPKTDMSTWEGKYIIQTSPILLRPAKTYTRVPGTLRLIARPPIGNRNDIFTISHDVFDKGYMKKPVKLLSATKYHLVIEENGQQIILDGRYTNVRSWALYEMP